MSDLLMAISRDRKQAVQAAFARAAETYDAHVDVQREVAAGLLASLTADADRMPGPAKILEIGCGTGNLTLGLADAFPKAEILAIDFCPQMLAVARRKLAGREQVSFEVADGEYFSPADPSGPEAHRFDLITSSAAFQWFEDLPLAVGRLARLLGPGGRLAFTMFGPGSYRELTSVLARSWPEADAAAADFLDGPAIRALLAPHFAEVQVAEEEHRREYPSLVELLRKIQQTGTGAGRWHGLLSPARLRRIEAEYRSQFGAIVASYQVYRCRGTRPASQS